jgi:hypothetical protein
VGVPVDVLVDPSSVMEQAPSSAALVAMVRVVVSSRGVGRVRMARR